MSRREGVHNAVVFDRNSYLGVRLRATSHITTVITPLGAVAGFALRHERAGRRVFNAAGAGPDKG